MELENSIITISNKIDNNSLIEQLADFFDLLAKFDYQDNLTEKSEIKTDSLESAPGESVLESD